MNIILIFLAYIFLIAVCYGIYYRKNAILISYSKAFEYFFFFITNHEAFHNVY